MVSASSTGKVYQFPNAKKFQSKPSIFFTILPVKDDSSGCQVVVLENIFLNHYFDSSRSHSVEAFQGVEVKQVTIFSQDTDNRQKHKRATKQHQTTHWKASPAPSMYKLVYIFKELLCQNLFHTRNCVKLDCKTVVFFANASDAVNSNERSGASVETARENGERR